MVSFHSPKSLNISDAKVENIVWPMQTWQQLDYMVQSKDKETGYKNKKEQPLSLDHTEHQVGKSRLCAVLTEAGAGGLSLGHQLSRQ